MEESVVPGENHKPASSHISSTPRLRWIRTQNVIRDRNLLPETDNTMAKINKTKSTKNGRHNTVQIATD